MARDLTAVEVLKWLEAHKPFTELNSDYLLFLMSITSSYISQQRYMDQIKDKADALETTVVEMGTALSGMKRSVSDLHRERTVILDVLKNCLASLKNFPIERCDHDVGICFCAEQTAIEKANLIIQEKVEHEPGQPGT